MELRAQDGALGLARLIAEDEGRRIARQEAQREEDERREREDDERRLGRRQSGLLSPNSERSASASSRP